MCKRVYLVGIGPGKENQMTMEAQEILRRCDAVIGARRMVRQAAVLLKESGHASGEVLESYQPEAIGAWLKERDHIRTAAVLLSGDPGFYSGARKLKAVLAEYEVIVVPGISSVVYLAGKLGVSWEDAKLASIHGRSQNYVQMIAWNAKTFLLLGGKENGAEVCGKIREYDLKRFFADGAKNFVRKIWMGCVRYWYKMSSRIFGSEEAFRMRNGSAEKFR